MTINADTVPASGIQGQISNTQLISALRVAREARLSYSGGHFSNLATLPGADPILVRADDKQSWTENFLRNEYLPFVFGTLNHTYLIFSMSEWTGFWWIKTGTKMPAYPFSHTISKPGAWWFEQAKDTNGNPIEDIQDVDNIKVAMEVAANWPGRRIVIGTTRGDDFQLLNDAYKISIGQPDPMTNGGGLLFSAWGLGDAVIYASAASFTAAHVGQFISNRFGRGKARITAVMASGHIQAEITEAWPLDGLPEPRVRPHEWIMEGTVPLTGAMNIEGRMLKAAYENLLLIAQAMEHFKDEPALDGFYLAHEPDHIASAAPLINRICNLGVPWDPGLKPLREYRTVDGRPLSFWVAPSSPIDVKNDAEAIAAGAALAGTGITHLHPQDTTGAGSPIFGPGPQWVQGIDNNIAQLPEMARLMKIVAARSGTTLVMHNELWEMAGPNYTNAYPASISRVNRQFEAYGNRGDFAVSYQHVGYTAMPGWSILPRQKQSNINDFQTCAIALAAGLIDRLRDK